jgi:hypothetical protein
MTQLNINIYKFEPSEFIELVEDGQKSTHAKPFEEHLEKLKLR